MKSRYKLLIAFLVVLLGCGIFLFWLKNYYPDNQDTALHRLRIMLFDINEIEVVSDDAKVDESKIKVIWSSMESKEKVVCENGEQVGSIGNTYGPQSFAVYFYDSLIGYASQMKTNNWHTHRYEINVHLIGSHLKPAFDFKAIGPNPVKEKNIMRNE